MATTCSSICSICEITAEAHVFDVTFNPTEPVVAATLVTGHINIYRHKSPDTLSEFSTELIHRLRPNKTSCRTARFINDTLFCSGYKDGRLVVTDLCTQTSVWKSSHHSDGVNALYVFDNNLFAAGDDEGEVTFWDCRTNSAEPAFSFHEFDDYISDMTASEDKQTLLATSGQHLWAMDVRSRGQTSICSNDIGDDLMCVGIARNGQKVVCGDDTGAINIFNWGEYGCRNDRATGHGDCIECLVMFDENTILTGCQDGLIRAVRLFPNSIAGIIGAHNEAEMPVERLALNPDKTLLASVSHDDSINYYSTLGIHRMVYDDYDGEDQQADVVVVEGQHNRSRTVPAGSRDMRASAHVFDDL
eukprot:GHVS01051525.1.p1 GENE.GHVS01051525.1~~GHVS01051525.1.p1  ORF type:complete len:360 (-),score=40.78 GHVS01051525.1:15-1094(-)